MRFCDNKCRVHLQEQVAGTHFEPVTDICSQDELPRPFNMMFVDQMTEMSQFTLTELLGMLHDQSRIMDVYYAVRLMKYNNMQDSEIVQILSKAKLLEFDSTDFLYLAVAKIKTEICENL